MLLSIVRSLIRIDLKEKLNFNGIIPGDTSILNSPWICDTSATVLRF
jgi:hypothetical protein